jgi:hypothetical protein
VAAAAALPAFLATIGRSASLRFPSGNPADRRVSDWESGRPLRRLASPEFLDSPAFSFCIEDGDANAWVLGGGTMQMDHRKFWLHYRSLRLAVEVVATLGTAALFGYLILQTRW